MGESDGHVVMPDPVPERDLPRGFHMRNGGSNPILDITTTLPRYSPPGRGPTMRSVGLEGSCMPRRAVPDDRTMFGNCGRLKSDRDILCPTCMPTDAKLFGHMKKDASSEIKRIGSKKKNRRK